MLKQLMDLWKKCLDGCLDFDLRLTVVIPPWERPRPFEAASRVEDLGLLDPMGSEAQSVHIQFKRFE